MNKASDWKVLDRFTLDASLVSSSLDTHINWKSRAIKVAGNSKFPESGMESWVVEESSEEESADEGEVPIAKHNRKHSTANQASASVDSGAPLVPIAAAPVAVQEGFERFLRAQVFPPIDGSGATC